MIVSVILLIILIVLIYIFVYLKHKDLWFKISKIPGPKPLPIFGNVTDLGRNPYEFGKNLLKLSEEFPSLFNIWVGPFDPIVFITDVKYLEILLTSQKHMKKGNDYNKLKPWTGDGLITSTGEKWRKRRKLITTAFHFKILEGFTERFEANGNILVEKLQKEVGKNHFDIYPYTHLAALDSICGM